MRLSFEGGVRSGSGFLHGEVAEAEAFSLLDEHVVVLDGVEDFSAGLALDELSVFRAGDDLDDGVFAGGGHGDGGLFGGIVPRAMRDVNCRIAGDDAHSGCAGSGWDVNYRSAGFSG